MASGMGRLRPLVHVGIVVSILVVSAVSSILGYILAYNWYVPRVSQNTDVFFQYE